jgi:hypothetical protein
VQPQQPRSSSPPSPVPSLHSILKSDIKPEPSPMPAKFSDEFAPSPKERHESLQRRKQAMLEKARW